MAPPPLRCDGSQMGVTELGRQYNRAGVLERLHREIAAGRPIYLVGAGIGISAKFAEKGGADLIATYGLARYRMAGLSSMAAYLPICDNNALTLELGEREIIPIVKEVPVIAGLLGTDPTRDMGRLLDKVKEVGFSGVHNCPTIALIDGTFRQVLEETGLRYDAEVEMIRMARERDLFTQAFVTSPEEAVKMVDAGADMIIAHMGNSVGGSVGSLTAISLDEAVARTQAIIDAAKSRNPDVLVICHGGPIALPKDFEYVLRRTKGLVGFMAGSSGERFPVEKGIREVTEEYKRISLV